MAAQKVDTTMRYETSGVPGEVVSHRANPVSVRGHVYRTENGRWRATGSVVVDATVNRGGEEFKVVLADVEFEADGHAEAADWLDAWVRKTFDVVANAASAAVHVDPNGSRG